MTGLYTAPADVLDRLRARFGVDGFRVEQVVEEGERILDLYLEGVTGIRHCTRMNVGPAAKVTAEDLDREWRNLADIVIAEADRADEEAARKPLPLVRIGADWLLLDGEVRVRVDQIVAYTFNDEERATFDRILDLYLEGVTGVRHCTRMNVGPAAKVTAEDLDREWRNLADIVIAEADRADEEAARKPLPLMRIGADWLLLDGEVRVRVDQIVAYTLNDEEGATFLHVQGNAVGFELSAGVAGELDRLFEAEGGTHDQT